MRVKFKFTPFRIVLLACVLFLLAFLVAYCQERRRVNALFEEAGNQQKQENFQRAVDLYKQVAVLDHGTRKGELAVLRAAEIYYYDMDSYRLAVNLLEKQIPISENSDLLIEEELLLAEMYIDKAGKTVDALKILQEIKDGQLIPDKVLSVNMMKANALRDLEKFEEAIKHYKQALGLVDQQKEEIEILTNIVACYASLFNRPEAEKYLRELLRKPGLTDEQSARFEWQLFENLDEQERYDEALQIINSMLTKNPGDPILLEERERIRGKLTFLKRAERRR